MLSRSCHYALCHMIFRVHHERIERRDEKVTKLVWGYEKEEKRMRGVKEMRVMTDETGEKS